MGPPGPWTNIGSVRSSSQGPLKTPEQPTLWTRTSKVHLSGRRGSGFDTPPGHGSVRGHLSGTSHSIRPWGSNGPLVHGPVEGRNDREGWKTVIGALSGTRSWRVGSGRSLTIGCLYPTCPFTDYTNFGDSQSYQITHLFTLPTES